MHSISLKYAIVFWNSFSYSIRTLSWCHLKTHIQRALGYQNVFIPCDQLHSEEMVVTRAAGRLWLWLPAYVQLGPQADQHQFESSSLCAFPVIIAALTGCKNVLIVQSTFLLPLVIFFSTLVSRSLKRTHMLTHIKDTEEQAAAHMWRGMWAHKCKHS